MEYINTSLLAVVIFAQGWIIWSYKELNKANKDMLSLYEPVKVKETIKAVKEIKDEEAKIMLQKEIEGLSEEKYKASLNLLKTISEHISQGNVTAEMVLKVSNKMLNEIE